MKVSVGIIVRAQTPWSASRGILSCLSGASGICGEEPQGGALSMSPGFCSPTPEGKVVQESPDLLLQGCFVP